MLMHESIDHVCVNNKHLLFVGSNGSVDLLDHEFNVAARMEFGLEVCVCVCACACVCACVCA